MSQENDLQALERVREKLTTPERIWVERLRIRWDDPKGVVITSREWERVRKLAAEAAQR